MLAQRMIMTTDPEGRLPSLPALPPNQRIEAIFLVLDETESDAPRVLRQPPPELEGKLKVHGDIMGSAPFQDWLPSE
jgi:hypothetical protein